MKPEESSHTHGTPRRPSHGSGADTCREGSILYRYINVAADAGITTITINRPEVRNALSLDTWAELRQAFTAVQADPAARALILTGAGDKAFASGGDLKELQKLTTAEAAQDMSTSVKATVQILCDLEIPTIAAVNGYALGGGCEVAVSCDFRIAAESAQLGYRQAKIGLISGWGGGPRLVQLLGRSRALRLMLTGATLTAQEALAIGLVDAVVPPEGLLPAARALAGEIAANPPLSVRAFKRLVNYCGEASLAAAIARETELFGPVWVSRDHDEAIAALFEKREPRFTGS